MCDKAASSSQVAIRPAETPDGVTNLTSRLGGIAGEASNPLRIRRPSQIRRRQSRLFSHSSFCFISCSSKAHRFAASTALQKKKKILLAPILDLSTKKLAAVQLINRWKWQEDSTLERWYTISSAISSASNIYLKFQHACTCACVPGRVECRYLIVLLRRLHLHSCVVFFDSGGKSKRYGWRSEIVLTDLRVQPCQFVGIMFLFLFNCFALSLRLLR